MTKSDLINEVNAAASDSGIDLTKKATGELIDIVFAKISSAIEAEKRFSYPDFGTFTVKHRKERIGRNPQDTSKKITIPASNTVSFKPAPKLKDTVQD